MNIMIAIFLMIGIDAFVIISGYMMGMKYYPEGCCSKMGSWIILIYILSVIPITFYFMLRLILK